MSAEPVPLFSIAPTQDGVWSVNERGPATVALAYFPSKWGALKHAVRAAKTRRRARVAVLERDGAVVLSRDYDTPGPPREPMEVP